MNRPWPAPAKLNLFLHVVGRRPDGYHELQTVFQLIDLCDFLSFRPTADGSVTRPAGPAGIAEEEDLAVRAARLLQAETGCPRGVRIRVDKRIPTGGGLGGGSSDAATTLVALNQLWGTGLSREALAELGLRLGADVPVFVGGRSAWAEGVGERLAPVDLPGRWFAVVGSLIDPEEARPAPIYIIDASTYQVVSVIRPKEDLGVELADHIHNVVWHTHNGQVFLVCQSWNPGYYFVLEQV
jgi:4-diphosphocytidyl-2-C-methyl-D-erythritol kinase